MPYDRILRHELLRSERFLKLPTDTHRLIFIALLTEADDFGNIEGGSSRMWRWMHGFSQVKDEAGSIRLMSDLQDVDLARRYEVEGKEFWHIPRFRNSRRYTRRHHPQSPWCGTAVSTMERKNKNLTPKSAADLRQICGRSAADLPRGVGVGVGVGVNPTTPTLGGNPKILGQSKSRDARKGSRLLSGFIPPESWFEFCREERPDLNPYETYDRFHDYWTAKPGKDGVKLDWYATWRNWVRNERHEARQVR